MNEELLLMLSTKALEMDFRWKDKPVKHEKVPVAEFVWENARKDQHLCEPRPT